MSTPDKAHPLPTESEWVEAELVRTMMRAAYQTQFAAWLVSPVFLGLLASSGGSLMLTLWCSAAGAIGLLGAGVLLRFDRRMAATEPATQLAFHRRFRWLWPAAGLVLGLAPGGAVRGAAYRIDEAAWPEVYAYLLEREQPTETYVEAARHVRLADGRRVEAVVFLSDVAHPQWAGALSLERQAELIAGAVGLSGPNEDYLRDLVAHLRHEGGQDRAMERLLAMVEARPSR